MENNKSTYIIAEAGVNHNGCIDTAKKLIDVAVDSGVDAIKFQSFKTEKLVSKRAKKAEYQAKTTNERETQYEMIKKLELSDHAHNELAEYCKIKKIEFLSTPFDEQSLDLLVERYNISKIKLSSGDLTNAPFLLKVARKRRPIILSTGMSLLSEVEQALSVLAFGFLEESSPSVSKFMQAYRSSEGQRLIRKYVTLLHCTTEYPTPFEDVNLNVMDTLKQAFSIPVGYSDHTEGVSIPIAAVSRGATVIEKHFTLDKSFEGPDHKASLDPSELKLMVRMIRQVEKSFGSPIKVPVESELKNIGIARKSILASRRIKKGELFCEENLVVKRPGDGLSPMNYWDLIGKKANKDYETEEAIK